METEKSLTILLIGEIKSDNVGDQIIGISVYNLINEQFPNAQIDSLDLSGRDGRIREYTIFEYVRLLNYYPFLFFHRYQFPCARRFVTTIRYIKTMISLMRKIREKHYNIVLFDGGALFQDYFSELIELVVKESSKFCDKILFHACGLGELSEYSVRCLARAFRNNKVSGISLRDSFQKFANLFPDISFIKTFDTALNCSRIFPFSQKESKKTEIGVGCISVPETFDIQCELVNALMCSDNSWKLFTTGEPADYRTAEKLLMQCKVDNPMEHLCYCPQCPDELIKIVNSFDSIISFRLHSLVLCASYGVPLTGIIWDQKVKFFLEGVGLNYDIDIRTNLTGEEIIKKRCTVLPEEIKKRINTLSMQTQKVLFDEVQGDRINGEET